MQRYKIYVIVCMHVAGKADLCTGLFGRAQVHLYFVDIVGVVEKFPQIHCTCVYVLLCVCLCMHLCVYYMYVHVYIYQCITYVHVHVHVCI